jgi:hypothetical protein
MRKSRVFAFTDAEGMSPGDIITYDPTKEGTRKEVKRGVIKEISRSLLSLMLEDGTPIGAARVYTCNHPGETEQAPLSPTALPAERRERRCLPLKEKRGSRPEHHAITPPWNIRGLFLSFA